MNSSGVRDNKPRPGSSGNDGHLIVRGDYNVARAVWAPVYLRDPSSTFHSPSSTR